VSRRSGGRPDFELTHTAAWLDLAEDRQRASCGDSRYGAYLRDRAGWWADDDPRSDPRLARARNAQRCWEIANGPIMSPGLVQLHPRILSATAHVDGHAGELVLCAQLAMALPGGLHTTLGYRWRSWTRAGGPVAEPAWIEPYERSGGPVRAALPTLALSWPVDAADIALTAGPGDVAAAIEAVTVVAELFNDELRPVLRHLAHSE
jgi:hypothetical protein